MTESDRALPAYEIVNHSCLSMSTKSDEQRSTIVDMKTLAERLKATRLERNETQEGLAKIGGVSKQAISKIESGATLEPASSTLEPIARHLSVNTRWLTDGRGPKTGSGSADDDSWSDINGVLQGVSLGDGVEPEEYAETHKLKFRAESLRRKHLRAENLAVIYGRGDSMQPTICDGDAIMLDMSDRDPKDGKLFVISIGKEVYAKRLVELGGQWFIDSDNKDDPKWRKPQPVDGARGFEIHGRVRWVARWED